MDHNDNDVAEAIPMMRGIDLRKPNRTPEAVASAVAPPGVPVVMTAKVTRGKSVSFMACCHSMAGVDDIDFHMPLPPASAVRAPHHRYNDDTMHYLIHTNS
jgi:hypothetical protein